MPNKERENIEELKLDDQEVEVEIENLTFDVDNIKSDAVEITSNPEVVHANQSEVDHNENMVNDTSSLGNDEVNQDGRTYDDENSEMPGEDFSNTTDTDNKEEPTEENKTADESGNGSNGEEKRPDNVNNSKDEGTEHPNQDRDSNLDKKNEDSLNDKDKNDSNLQQKQDNLDDKNQSSPNKDTPKDEGKPQGSEKGQESKNRDNAGKKENGGNNSKSAIDKKREEAKNKQNNRNKAPKAGNSNSNKNPANSIKNGLKNKASNALNKSKAGRAINKAKNTVEKGKKAVEGVKKAATAAKAIISFLGTPAGWISIAVAVVVLVLIIFLPSLFATASPLLGGDVQNEENYDKYSDVDRKTIDNLKKIYEKYPNGDPAYAMVATIYPYMEDLQSGNVTSIRGKTNEEQTDSEGEEEEGLTSNELEDSEDNQDDATEDDPYLVLLRQRTYYKKFEKLLKKSVDGEESLTNYLKDSYFNSDAGYKDLFNGTSDKEELADAIINDLLSLKDDFNGYFFENCITSNASTTPLNAAGNVKSLKGSIYVTLRDYFADSDGTFRTEGYYNSPVLYNTDSDPLTFARYIMGVVYAESESCLNSESCAKTLMITAKSFAIGRQTSMGYEPEYIESENKTIIHMRGNVGDQDFCDVYEGCETGRFSKDSWQTFTGEGYKNRKGPLASDKLANLEKWWNEIADQYVINKESGKFAGNQYNDYNDSCKQGSCVSQTLLKESSEKEKDYMNLLFNSTNGGFDNSSYVLFTATNNELYAVTTGTEVCDDGTATASRQKIVNFAKSMVGQIPYYFYEGNSDGYGALGHALSKNFDDNHFGELTSIADHAGRDKYGLDCSGFVDFVFWNTLDNNLGNGNTDTLKSVSIEIDYSDLKPGDLGFLNNGSSGTKQHVGIYIGNDKWIELNPNGVTEGPYPDFKVYYRPNILVELDANETEQGDGVSTGEMVSPIEGKTLTCSDYPYYSDDSYHGGTDLSVEKGTNVVAMDGGTVITSKDITSGDCSGDRHCNEGYYSYGRYIEIQHDNGIVTKYAHLSERLVEKGDKVSKGQLIGKSGNTGNSEGAHLHIEVIKDGNNQNPCDFIKK